MLIVWAASHLVCINFISKPTYLFKIVGLYQDQVPPCARLSRWADKDDVLMMMIVLVSDHLDSGILPNLKPTSQKPFPDEYCHAPLRVPSQMKVIEEYGFLTFILGSLKGNLVTNRFSKPTMAWKSWKTPKPKNLDYVSFEVMEGTLAEIYGQKNMDLESI